MSDYPCQACGDPTSGRRREVAMTTTVREVVPGCVIAPRRIYWCCDRCVDLYGEYVPAVTR